MSPLLTGFPFSAGGVGKATVTASTGSPTIDTTSRPGKTIYKFTGSGSITVGTAGYAEVLIVAGGGAGLFYAGGGAGGYYYNSSYFIASGTQTVTVGAGGSATTPPAVFGNSSSIGTVSYTHLTLPTIYSV